MYEGFLWEDDAICTFAEALNVSAFYDFCCVRAERANNDDDDNDDDE